MNEVHVVGGRPHPPSTLVDVHILADAPAALSALRDAGFILVGVTNQPDVARGTQRREVVEEINRAVQAALPLAAIFTCYHDDADACDCRKPRPGLLTRAAAEYSIDLATSYMIGDRWKDVEAGRRAGCRTILVGEGYGEDHDTTQPDVRVRSLLAGANWILSRMTVGGD